MPRHLVVRPLGVSPQGETWTFGMHFCRDTNGDSSVSTDQLQEWADDLAGLNSNKFLNAYILSMISAALYVSGVRVEQIGPDGKLESAAESLYASAVPGTGTAQRTIQTALVVSLNRGAQYGRNGRGRCYIPSLAAPAINGTDLRVLAGSTNDVCTSFNQLQAAVGSILNEDIIASPYILSVYSPTKQTLVQVANLAVGDVFDTQRRRRDKWVEARAVQART